MPEELKPYVSQQVLCSDVAGRFFVSTIYRSSSGIDGGWGCGRRSTAAISGGVR